MVPVVAVVGKSNAGKTTFLEGLIPELSARGWRVGTVKHDAHKFDIDKPGKDTWRHAQAGSLAVVISSSEKVALIRRVSGETTLDGLAAMIEGTVDIVLTEGFKRSNAPKIEISRREAATEILCSQEELLALVTDHHVDLDVPQFALDDYRSVADLVEERFLRGKERDSVSLLVDGKRIVLKPFALNVLDRTVRSILSLLEGCEGAKDVSLTLRGNQKT